MTCDSLCLFGGVRFEWLNSGALARERDRGIDRRPGGGASGLLSALTQHCSPLSLSLPTSTRSHPTARDTRLHSHSATTSIIMNRTSSTNHQLLLWAQTALAILFDCYIAIQSSILHCHSQLIFHYNPICNEIMSFLCKTIQSLNNRFSQVYFKFAAH